MKRLALWSTCRCTRRRLHKAFSAWLAMVDAAAERHVAAEAILSERTCILAAACLDAWRWCTERHAAARCALQAMGVKTLASQQREVSMMAANSQQNRPSGLTIGLCQES